MRRSGLISGVWGLGMALVFMGERAFGAGTARAACTIAGLTLVVASAIARGIRVSRTGSDARAVERTLLGLQLAGIGALVLYFVQSDAVTRLAGKPLDQGFPRLAGALAVLWPVVWLMAAAPLALCELAYASVARAARLERGRIRDAQLTGLGLAFALTFAFSIAYVTGERDGKLDLSHFRTARPGESTRKIVQALGETVQVALFFPPANEVHEELASYFGDLKKESARLEVNRYDHAVDPARAKELGVSGNGIVVVARGGRKEQLAVPIELESARSALRSLDRSVQKLLLTVAKPPRNAYLTRGHGERERDRLGETDKRDTIAKLRDLLEDQGYTLRDLGPAEGLMTEVPSDAGVVVVVGPSKPFLPEELATLVRYVERGGRLFVALDPEAGLDLRELLGPLGLRFNATPLANDQIYARRTSQTGDRANIATGSYSSHPSVTTLGRLAMRAPIVLFGAGFLERAGEGKDAPKDVTIDFTVHAHAATWNDANGNFEVDAPAETRKAYELAAAVTRRGTLNAGKMGEDGRVVVLADSDGVADQVLPNTGNAYFVLDGLRWLMGDENVAGEISSEQDVPIAHTRKQDAVWFYSSIFVAPALVLFAGRMATRRRRRKPPSTPAAPRPPTAEGPLSEGDKP